jgi:AraC-like DNA-binding protein
MPPSSCATSTEIFGRRKVAGRSRSTLGCARAAAGGFNHYPATPFCAVAWILDGTAQMVVGHCPDGELGQAGDVLFCGPQNAPYSTWNHGPARLFAALFYPDAMHALLGRELSGYVDSFHPAQEVLGQDWAGLFPALHGAADDAARARLVDAFLQPRWEAVRAHAAGERSSLADWSRNLALRAATSQLGHSVRHAERRVRAWAGLPMRTLNRLSRAEQALVLARAGQERGTLSWSDVAAGTGYSDQAHLSRETRAITGLSPTELARAIQHDDSYWLYRIWS